MVHFALGSVAADGYAIPNGLDPVIRSLGLSASVTSLLSFAILPTSIACKLAPSVVLC